MCDPLSDYVHLLREVHIPRYTSAVNDIISLEDTRCLFTSDKVVGASTVLFIVLDSLPGTVAVTLGAVGSFGSAFLILAAFFKVECLFRGTFVRLAIQAI